MCKCKTSTLFVSAVDKQKWLTLPLSHNSRPMPPNLIFSSVGMDLERLCIVWIGEPKDSLKRLRQCLEALIGILSSAQWFFSLPWKGRRIRRGSAKFISSGSNLVIRRLFCRNPVLGVYFALLIIPTIITSSESSVAIFLVAPFRCLYNWDLKLIVWDNFGVHTKYAIKEFLQRFEL
jgi:hypothetical protein